MTNFISKISNKKANEVRINNHMLFTYEHLDQVETLLKDFFTGNVYILIHYKRQNEYALWEADTKDAEYTINMYYNDLTQHAQIARDCQIR